MADIFREIDEDVRRVPGARRLEQARQQVHRTRCPDRVEGGRSTRSGSGPVRGCRRALRRGRSSPRRASAEEAGAAFTGIAKDAPSGYATLRFRAASSETAKADSDKGLKAFEALAADSTLSPLLRDMARLRIGLLGLDTLSREDLKSRLEPLLSSGTGLAGNARELLGLAALKAGDYEGAGNISTRSSPTRTAPPSLKQRASPLRCGPG